MHDTLSVLQLTYLPAPLLYMRSFISSQKLQLSLLLHLSRSGRTTRSTPHHVSISLLLQACDLAQQLNLLMLFHFTCFPQVAPILSQRCLSVRLPLLPPLLTKSLVHLTTASGSSKPSRQPIPPLLLSSLIHLHLSIFIFSTQCCQLFIVFLYPNSSRSQQTSLPQPYPLSSFSLKKKEKTLTILILPFHHPISL